MMGDERELERSVWVVFVLVQSERDRKGLLVMIVLRATNKKLFTRDKSNTQKHTNGKRWHAQTSVKESKQTTNV